MGSRGGVRVAGDVAYLGRASSRPLRLSLVYVSQYMINLQLSLKLDPLCP